MITTWQDALDRLYGLANWETRPEHHDFQVARFADFLHALGDPHGAWPAVHVAGTNGKGSTCAVTAAVLQAAGYAVGLYTSPHMHTVRERARVNGELIPAEFVIEWLNAHETTMARHDGLTTFEALTALAFSWFAARGVDVAVVEVGLGGRLDATRVVRPAVTVHTPIDLDHTDVLGETVEAIARDKAAVLRPGVPAVSAPQRPEVAAVLAEAAEAVGTRLVVVGRDVTWRRVDGPEGATLDVLLEAGGHVRGRAWLAGRVEVAPRLRGRYQEANVVTGLAAVAELARAGWAVSEGAMACGVALARWPGRFEELAPDPRRPGVALVVDSAHNPAGARALSEALAADYSGRRRFLVLGASRGKDFAGVLEVLVPGAAAIVATESRHPRAVPAAELGAAVAASGAQPEVVDDPAAALEWALTRAAPGDVIVAAGSIFVAAAVREAWLAHLGLPLPERDGPPHG